MSQDNLDEVTFRKIRGELPQLFTKNAFPPVEVSMDGLVTIKIDALFQVSSVTIRGLELKPEKVALLEQTLVKAMNKANQEVAKRNAERVIKAIGKSGA